MRKNFTHFFNFKSLALFAMLFGLNITANGQSTEPCDTDFPAPDGAIMYWQFNGGLV